MSDIDEESIGEDLEFDDEESHDEFGQSFEPYTSEANVISPINKSYKIEKETIKSAAVPFAPLLTSNPSSQSLDKSTLDDYSMDFSEAANETNYSEDFDTDAATAVSTSSVASTRPSTQRLSVQFKNNDKEENGSDASGGAYGSNKDINDNSNTYKHTPGHAYGQQYHQPYGQQQPNYFQPPLPPTSNSSYPPPVPIPIQQVPAMSIQALQAEVAVEQLSKEVIKLRNQHRNVLRQRREIVESKKSRAEDRRAKYNLELQELRDGLTSSQAANAELQQQIVSLNGEVARLIENRDVIQASVGRLERTINTQNDTCSHLQAEVQQLEQQKMDRAAELTEKQDQWRLQAEAYLLTIEKLKLHNDVAAKSIQASEARISKERENLPVFHQKRLDEEVARLQALQEAMADKETRLRADEESKMNQLEKLREDLLAEVNASRMQMQRNIDDQKAQLDTQKKEFEASKTRTEMQLNATAAENDSIKVQLQQYRHEIEVERREVERQRNELTMSVAMVEPNLLKIQKDKAESEDMKQHAAAVLQQVTEQANELIHVERKLVEREKECNQLSSQLACSLEELRTKIHQSQTEEKTLAVTRKQMQNEKFALHQCMMEMHRQMDVLKMAMRQAANIIPVQGILSSSLIAVGNRGEYDNRDHSDGVPDAEESERNENLNKNRGNHTISSQAQSQSAMRILFTLEQSSEQLSQLMAQAVAKGSYNVPSVTQYMQSGGHQSVSPLDYHMPCSEANENVNNYASNGYENKNIMIATTGPTHMMQTYEHCTSISKQLMELGKKQLVKPVDETSNLIGRYNALSVHTGCSNSVATATGAAAGDMPLCLHSVLDDISNSTDKLNSIAHRYSASL